MADAPVRRDELAVLGLAGGLLVLWGPSLNAGLLTPRIALTLVAAGPGLVSVVGLAWRRDLAARLLLAFLGWTFLSAVLCGQPRIALLGTYGSDLGWVHILAWCSIWGLGRRLGPGGRSYLPLVLIGGVAINALVALAQMGFDTQVGLLRVLDGRASGLAPSSLFLGGLVCGGLGLLGHRIGRTAQALPVALAVVVLLAMAGNLSGSRVTLVAGAALAVVPILLPEIRTCLRACPVGHARRQVPLVAGDRAARLLRAGLVVAALVLGTVLSLPLASATGGTERVGSGGGMAPRVEMWEAGLRAVGERPVLGWGSGRFRAATSDQVTAAFVREQGPERLFFDAHDLFVEHLVADGIVGLALLVGFGVVAARRARGPLAWFAAGVAVTWLLNPMSVATAPLALLALGAAAPWSPLRAEGEAEAPAAEDRLVSTARRSRPAVVIGTALALVGAAAGGCLVAADALLARATTNGDVALVQRAERLLPPDSVVSDLETSAWRIAVTVDGDRSARPEALASAERTVHLDPTRSTWWTRLGDVQLGYLAGTKEQRWDAAERSYRRALERDPWSLDAMTGMVKVAALRGDTAEAERWKARICEIVTCR